jgi:hypothetical protein
MRPELEVHIRACWPDWFGQHTDTSKSLMGVGFQHGDGWFDLLVRTFKRIEPEVAAFNLELAKIGTQFEIIVVRQRFGELSIVAMPTTTEIIFAFLDARYESLTICELCGAPGTLHTACSQTLCQECMRRKAELHGPKG